MKLLPISIFISNKGQEEVLIDDSEVKVRLMNNKY